MFRCIGKYGNYHAHEIDFGETETIEQLLSVTIKQMNSLKPETSVHFYVFQKNEMVGRFMRYEYDDITCYLHYVPKEEVVEFIRNKKKRLGLN